MGNRERLLEGARRCLYERGYARTTARDIVAASGTNLASIGYHFGSKEALLDAALIEAVGEMTDRVLEISSGDVTGDLPGAWDRILAEFEAYRPLLVAHVEAWAQVERSPSLRAQFAEVYRRELDRGTEHARAHLPDVDEPAARSSALVTGLLADGLIVKWLVDPDGLPNGHDIANGLRALADVLDPA